MIEQTKNTGKNLEKKYLGLIDFEKSYQLQQDLHKISVERGQNFLLGLEHESCLTLGLRSHQDIDFISEKSPWPAYKINRGGLVTVHNPGQLVIYPICNLKELKMGVRCFVHNLLVTTQKTLKDFNIESEINETDQPGIYTKSGKIAFCGVQVKQGTTLHGMSINIQNDLNDFNQFGSCGVEKPQLDKVSLYRSDVSLKDFFEVWNKNWENVIASCERSLN